ncbi:MAG: hypothetical protein MJZ93_01335 [Paludibacteraceae bacterium]|nr:hypothetical protein [Paludibacteraceae bacterium]
MMKKIYIYIVFVVTFFGNVNAQGTLDYDRSSLYSISLVYKSEKYAEDIARTFMKMNVPDKFNDHSLNLRVIPMSGKPRDTSDDEIAALMGTFFLKNQIARRMVARWFNRDKETGAFDVNLIKDRGNYNATVMDVATAMKTVRGRALIEDAGEQLIGNTFIVVNEISYIDKERNAQIAALVLVSVGALLGAVANIASSVSNMGNNKNNKTSQEVAAFASLGSTMANLGGVISQAVAGFTVNVKSHLFQLDWNDEVAAKFYDQYYFDESEVSPEKKAAFDNDNSTFKMKYIGYYSSRSSKTVLRGLHNNDEVFMKVLTRATDKNIVELQRKFPMFKVVSNVASVENKSVYVQIGLKEGVSPTSKYEVLQRTIGSDGHISYTRKAVIKPVADKIWDNRCMAVEEMAENATLNATEFTCTFGSVSAILPGMIVREIKM